jgi:hypothetical protein
MTIVVCGLTKPLQAQISVEDAQKPYEVTFIEWVFVYLNATFKSNTENYWVRIYPQMVEGKWKMMVTGGFLDNEAGNKWFQESGRLIRPTIQSLCESWTSRGHKTTLDDFQFDFKKIILEAPSKP